MIRILNILFTTLKFYSSKSHPLNYTLKNLTYTLKCLTLLYSLRVLCEYLGQFQPKNLEGCCVGEYLGQ